MALRVYGAGRSRSTRAGNLLVLQNLETASWRPDAIEVAPAPVSNEVGSARALLAIVLAEKKVKCVGAVLTRLVESPSEDQWLKKYAAGALRTLYLILLKNPPFILREPQDERWGG